MARVGTTASRSACSGDRVLDVIRESAKVLFGATVLKKSRGLTSDVVGSSTVVSSAFDGRTKKVKAADP
jgi:hypothetical protein